MDVRCRNTPEILPQYLRHVSLATGGFPCSLEFAMPFPPSIAQDALHKRACGPWRGRRKVGITGRLDAACHVSGRCVTILRRQRRFNSGSNETLDFAFRTD